MSDRTREELLHVMGHVFLVVARVDLETDRVCILYHRDGTRQSGLVYDWPACLRWFASSMNIRGSDEVVDFFSAANLLQHFRAGASLCSREVSFPEGDGDAWMTVQAFLRQSDCGQVYAYIVLRRSDEEHLLRNIIIQYLYSNCDFFLCLDARNDSYSLFKHSYFDRPVTSKSYTVQMDNFINDFVVPEERSFVSRETRIPRIIEALEHGDCHALSCTLPDQAVGTVQKRLEYRYHDRARQKVLLSCTDITAGYRAEQTYRQSLRDALKKAQTDSLTGLLNYQGTVDEINARLADPSGRFALLFLDLDNFKSVNDTLGHVTGDTLLREIAGGLRAGTRESDVVGRVGGDEFVVFMRWVRSLSQVEECAQRLLDNVRNISGIVSHGLPLSCSIGIALAPEDGRDYETLVKKADKLTYQSKKSGKGRYSL